MLYMVVLANNQVYCSFADYTDEEAEKDTQNMIQEYETKFDSTKSENNYLKNLIVEGGTLSPNFDRQVIEYSLKVDNNINEINIIANAEDNDAKINGIGKININNISECKIEVIAASGTMRTYFIKIAKENKDDIIAIDTNVNKNVYSENTFVEDTITNYGGIEENQQINNQEKGKKNSIIIISILVLFMVLVLCMRKNRKSKH